MSNTLLSLFPNHDDLLSQQPEDLGGAILEIAPGVMQNGMFNTAALLAQLFPQVGNTGYPRGLHEQVRLAIAEALSWLTNRGLVMLDPDQPASWYRPTRRGATLKTRADVAAFRNQAGLGFEADTPLPLRAGSHTGGALLSAAAEVLPPVPPQASEPPSGTTLITPAPETLAVGTSDPARSTAAPDVPAGARAPDTQPAVPVQSYLVTTPLRGVGADLISLTLRFRPTLHNIVSDAVPELIRAGLEGWTREMLGSGDALLDRLADGDASLRDAVVAALDNRAAVLQFSDPTPFPAGDLKRIRDGIVAFSRLKPRTAVVGVITLSACLIAVQVSWGVGRGLSTTAEYAVVEVGKALVDGITAKLRETNTR
jgi:hypothetical protein